MLYLLVLYDLDASRELLSSFLGSKSKRVHNIKLHDVSNMIYDNMIIKGTIPNFIFLNTIKACAAVPHCIRFVYINVFMNIK